MIETLRSTDRFPSILVAELSRRTVLPGSSGEFAVWRLMDGGRYGILLHGLPPVAYVSDIRIGSRSILPDGVFVASPNQETVEFQICRMGPPLRRNFLQPELRAMTGATKRIHGVLEYLQNLRRFDVGSPYES